MPTLIADTEVEAELIEARREYGHDLRDEVWEGTYVVMPLGNEEHQRLAGRFSQILLNVLDYVGGDVVYPGVNLTDRVPPEDWRENFRCPDVAVFLAGTSAENRGSHWYGGPDLAVEIVSPNDRTYEKLGFYAGIRTKELLVIDRDPWALRLYRLDGSELREVPPEADGGVRTRSVDAVWRVGNEPGVRMTLECGGKAWPV